VHVLPFPAEFVLAVAAHNLDQRVTDQRVTGQRATDQRVTFGSGGLARKGNGSRPA
jgi:hypothetical protein